MLKKCLRMELSHHVPLFSRTVGVNRPQNPRYRPNGLLENQVSLVTAGHGVLVLGDVQYELEAGDMFFLRSWEPHSYYGTDEHFSISWVIFTGIGTESLLSYYGAEHSAVYRHKHFGKFEKRCLALYEAFDSEISFPALMAKAQATVISFFDEALASQPTPAEQIKIYLEKHYGEPLSLDRILQSLGYSKSKLCADFKKVYGKTVFEMLTDIRLQNAKELLEEDPEILVKEVALSCGFNDCSYFCRLYRKAFGQSPKSAKDPSCL